MTMIKLEKPTKLIELVLLSAYLKDEQPVSALVTALPEAGKTEMIMRFAQNKGCVTLSDCTAYGIMHDYKKRIIDREVRHLIIADLVKPLSRGKDTVHSLIAFFNSMVEEGVLGQSTYAEHIVPEDGKPTPIKCGLIATLAREVLEDGRHHFSKMGFLSRMVPISYDYSMSTILQIRKSIASKEYLDKTPITVELPAEDVNITLDKPQSDVLIQLATSLVSPEPGADGKKVYGFRLQKQIQRLAMADALKNKRDRVTDEDIDELLDLSTYINLKYNPI